MKRLLKKLENIYAAAAYSEAGEFESAREILREIKSEDSQLRKITVNEQLSRLKAN